MRIRAGIDVSAKKLHVATSDPKRRTACFDNNRKGRRALAKWLTKGGRTARVCLEATGIYSLDPALELDARKGIELMVANPRSVHAYREAVMKRGKTDAIDADVLLAYVGTVSFTKWQRPSETSLQLRQLTRSIDRLTRDRTRELNRLHALESTPTTLPIVINDTRKGIEQFERRIDLLRKAAYQLIKQNSSLRRMYVLLSSVKGVGHKSAIALVGELAMLPEDMDVRQWVAHAGLDPMPHQSGSSVNGSTPISKRGNKYLRQALFMPALTARQRDPHVKAYANKLVSRGKSKLQAVVAVMRKLLHAFYGMLRHDTPWDGSKFYAGPLEEGEGAGHQAVRPAHAA